MKANKLNCFLTYSFLIVVSFFSIFPFLWMIVGATNTSTEIVKGKLTVGTHFIENLFTLFRQYNMTLILYNTFKITILTTVLSLFITSIAGYGFEMYKSKLREKIYSLVLLTMMVPFAAILIPLFRIFTRAGLLDSHWAVIIPGITNIFLIFFFRQNTKSFPKDLVEAARVDGLNELQIFFRIYFPVMKSTYAAAAIFSFMANWNNFLWPLVILQSQKNKTITLVISSLASAYKPDFGVIMVAIIFGVIPTIIIVFFMQKLFVKGMTGSVKG